MSKPRAYYNEIDPHACAWLQGLMDHGLIMAGKIDDRSIHDVSPDDVKKFTRVGFFAGIGGWDYALQLAGWPADRPVWHGSCPCQPFSVAGKGEGNEDDRHLWPAFFDLIRQCRPDTVFGEQVESAIGHGWLDGIRADLEGEDYACGDATLGAHSVGAPHLRQRLYWVANSCGERVRGWVGGEDVGSSGKGESQGAERQRVWDDDRNVMHRMADSVRPGLEGHGGHEHDRGQPGRVGTDAAGSTAESGATSHWVNSIWIPCRDGKHRRIPTQSEIFPLADGLSYKLARRGSVRPALLKGAGNAIVPQVAAIFIEAFDGAELL